MWRRARVGHSTRLRRRRHGPRRRRGNERDRKMTISRIAVLGGGAWGTALAQTCARAGRSVSLWEHEPGNAENLESRRESRFLPGVRLDDGIKVTRDLAEAARADAMLLVVPAQAMRSVLTSLAQSIAPRTPLIACAGTTS